jgi:hypothetical protein
MKKDLSVDIQFFYRRDKEKCYQQIPITFNPVPSCWDEVFLEYERTKGCLYSSKTHPEATHELVASG